LITGDSFSELTWCFAAMYFSVSCSEDIS
jgi:hypothetical protein